MTDESRRPTDEHGHHDKGGPSGRVRVVDRRRTRPQAVSSEPHGDAASDVAEDNAPADAPSAKPAPEHDYLEDLRRLQAEFDNYRKRMIREQTELTRRAAARLIEKLLPVLDNFERALDHAGESEGLVLVHKELMAQLSSEGLEEIASAGEPFDPRLHEAVESHEDPGVAEPVVTGVYRTGYKLAGRVLRPAMVVVARPPDVQEGDPGSEEPASEREG